MIIAPLCVDVLMMFAAHVVAPTCPAGFPAAGRALRAAAQPDPAGRRGGGGGGAGAPVLAAAARGAWRAPSPTPTLTLAMTRTQVLLHGSSPNIWPWVLVRTTN